MINIIPGTGVLIERGSGKYLEITEAVDVKFQSSWQNATVIEKVKWDNPDLRQQMIDFHELNYTAHTLEFVPMEKLLDPFGDWPEPDEGDMRH
jgi:hypothetical protein